MTLDLSEQIVVEMVFLTAILNCPITVSPIFSCQKFNRDSVRSGSSRQISRFLLTAIGNGGISRAKVTRGERWPPARRRAASVID